MDFSAALPTFVITLREGVEAALVVGIVLACLKKANASRLNSWVFAGILAGIVASALIGVLFSWAMQTLRTSNWTYAPVVEPLLEGGFCVVAIAMLSWMLIWMTQQAKSLKAEVEGAVSAALQQETAAAGWGVFGLIFIAVLREGFETVLFIVAKFQQGLMPALGSLAGLAGAAGIGVLLFKWGVKINIRRFFQVMGVFLLLIVSGLVISALKKFDAAGSILSQLQPQFANFCIAGSPSCILGPVVWDATNLLPDNQFPGVVLKALFGYRAKLYLAQAAGYILFLVTAGTLYFQSIAGRSIFSSKHLPSVENSVSSEPK
ncbi:FTR1 family protein [Microcoleus sp. FACHB-68]|uniref:FTR1 family iron permease n=1 Tax=Microcoleus sp. FACHB-68 TaxID=2692826 RepID=UPI00168572BA|nr:FTR1 family protein [Microcoleus sp. FACHB-68]MBD1940367.1 FTR1 family iron permease [Microcoleus sp. FACHB-68]